MFKYLRNIILEAIIKEGKEHNVKRLEINTRDDYFKIEYK